jgi:hypothetical protein
MLRSLGVEDNMSVVLNISLPSSVLKKKHNRLVQSARQYYVQPLEAQKGCGFEGSKVDPCLWVKNSSSGIVLMDIYVNDCARSPLEQVWQFIRLFRLWIWIESKKVLHWNF